MPRIPIDGTNPMYIDSEGYVVDEYFRKVEPKTEEDGRQYVLVNGEKRYVDTLVYEHFANKGQGAVLRKDEQPDYKDGDKGNCHIDNLVIVKSRDEKKKEVLQNADSEDEVEANIIALFVDDPEATYDDITKRMKDTYDTKVSRNQIASAKKVWKKAKKEAGQA